LSNDLSAPFLRRSRLLQRWRFRENRTPPRRIHFAIVVLLLGLAFYHAVTLDSAIINFEDSAVYVVLAEALSGGQGYTLLSHVGDPAHVQYPPIFPLLLAPLVYFFGRQSWPMQAMLLIFTLASLLAIYLFLRHREGEKKALLITAVVGISPAFFSYSHQLMSEIPYLCISFLALHFLRRYNQESRWISGSGAAAVIFIILAYLSRSIGFTLLLTAAFTLLLLKPAGRFQHKLVAVGIVLAICALPAFGWSIRNTAVAQSAGTRSYADTFIAKNEFAADEGTVESPTDLLPRFRRNLSAYGYGTVALLFPFLRPTREPLVTAAVLGLVIVGFASHLWYRKDGAEVYVAAYGLILLLFPSPVVPRYLLPLFPFLLLYVIGGLETLIYPLGKRLGGVAFVALATTLLVANSTGAATVSAEQQGGLADYRSMAAWLNDHTPPESVVLSRKPTLLYLWGDRKGAKFPYTANTQSVLQVICDKQVNYVVRDSFSPVTTRFLAPVLEQHREVFTLVHSQNDTYLFLVDRTTGCGEGI
jgi:4-amino-4-deoxy-L-arabinose transferase-like glycosyltransferase